MTDRSGSAARVGEGVEEKPTPAVRIIVETTSRQHEQIRKEAGDGVIGEAERLGETLIWISIGIDHLCCW
jgi:hypothetical protein